MSAMDDLSFERPDEEAERLAAGFAEHVVRWARRGGCDEASVPTLRRVAHATSLATSNGHVCVLLSELGQLPDGQTLRTTLLNCGVVGTPDHPGSLPLILDEDGRLYLHRYFDYEVRLARRLMQAAKEPPRAVSPEAGALLDSLFPAPTDGDVDWQKIAAALALRGSLTVISGGPGTGKTTTVVNLLACLLMQAPGTRVALAAPTGKAAARMTETIRQRSGHLPAELRAKLPQESFTIHRLLGATAGLGRFRHDAGNPIPYDALIVDEASMLDLALAARLLEAVPASARIVLLGDKDQLAAVEAGAVFAELSADPTLTRECRHDLGTLCGYAPERIAPPAPAQASPLRDVAVWLTRNYRFAADSAIGRLARCVNEGRAQEALALLRESRGRSAEAISAPPSAKSGRAKRTAINSLPLFPELEAGQGASSTSMPGSHLPVVAASSRNSGDQPVKASIDAMNPDSSIQWLDPRQGDNAMDAILAGYADYFDTVRRDPADVDAIYRAFNGFRVLCAVREGPQGIHAINEQVARRARLAMAVGGQADGPDPRSPWYVGRPIVVARNDSTLKLSNGDVGIALPDPTGVLSVFLADGADGYRSVPIMRMPPHDTAFAMTTHKAQGSEFERLLLLMPARPSRVLSRELLYTAITRAKAGVTVSGDDEVIAMAIGVVSSRPSGLRSRLVAASGPGADR